MHAGLQVDMAYQGTDREAVEMAAHLLRCDGLFLGSSAAMNCVGAVKASGPRLTLTHIFVCTSMHLSFSSVSVQLLCLY